MARFSSTRSIGPGVPRQLASASSFLFATGCLYTQLMTVRRWQAAPSGLAARAAFRSTGPRTGGVLFPVEVIASALLVRTAVADTRAGRPSAPAAITAAISMLATGAMLVYFLPVNLRLLGEGVPEESVLPELARWRRWNALRTGCAALASVASAVASMIAMGGRASR